MSLHSGGRRQRHGLAQVAMRVVFWSLWMNGLLSLLQDATILSFPSDLEFHKNDTTTTETPQSTLVWKLERHLSDSNALIGPSRTSTPILAPPPSDNDDDKQHFQPDASTPAPLSAPRSGTNSTSPWWIVASIKGASHNAIFIISVVLFGLAAVLALVDFVAMSCGGRSTLCSLKCCCCCHFFQDEDHDVAFLRPSAGDMDSALSFAIQNPVSTSASVISPPSAPTAPNCCICGSSMCSTCHCTVCGPSDDDSESDESETLLPKARSSVFQPFADESASDASIETDSSQDMADADAIEDDNNSQQSRPLRWVRLAARVSLTLIRRTMWLVCFSCGGGCCRRRRATLEDGRNFTESQDNFNDKLAHLTRGRTRAHTGHHSSRKTSGKQNTKLGWVCSCNSAVRMRCIAWFRCSMYLTCAVALSFATIFHWTAFKGPHEPLCWLALLGHSLSILALIACAPTVYCTSRPPSERRYRGRGGNVDPYEPSSSVPCLRADFEATSDEENPKAVANDSVGEYQAMTQAEEEEEDTGRDQHVGLRADFVAQSMLPFPYNHLVAGQEDLERQGAYTWSPEEPDHSLMDGLEGQTGTNQSGATSSLSTYAEPGQTRIHSPHPHRLKAHGGTAKKIVARGGEGGEQRGGHYAPRAKFFGPPSLGGDPRRPSATL